MSKSSRIVLAMVCLCSPMACDGSLTADGGSPAQLWTGNAADCPAQPPQDLAECTVAEGQICAYNFKDPSSGQQVYRAFACREASSTSLKWDSYYNATGLWTCPAPEPVHGSGCVGFVGETCHYPPLTECTCPAQGSDSAWSCGDARPAKVSPPPASIDASQAVKDMSAADRDAWCQWYAAAGRPEGSPQPPETPLTSDGYTTNTAITWGSEFFCSGCLPQLPVSYCVGNLSLSSCAAPLAELTDCALTIFDGGWPPVHGCARYFEKAGCDGTIVIAHESGLIGPDAGAGGFGGDSCALKVQ